MTDGSSRLSLTERSYRPRPDCVVAISLFRMRPRLSVARRLTLALVGLVTTWCLGCSGYDSLLSSLMAKSAPMSCESQMMAPSSTPHQGGSAVQASDQGVDCNCQSCVAASPIAWSLGLPRVERPATTTWIADAPFSIARAPLLPPPQSV
jgi:hypothetical protein